MQVRVRVVVSIVKICAHRMVMVVSVMRMAGSEGRGGRGPSIGLVLMGRAGGVVRLRGVRIIMVSEMGGRSGRREVAGDLLLLSLMVGASKGCVLLLLLVVVLVVVLLLLLLLVLLLVM